MLILGVCVLLCLSAFFSGTETAVMALDRYQVRTMAEEGDHQAMRLMAYLNNPERFFAVVLLGNTFANLAATSLFTLWLVQIQDEVVIAASSILFPITVLLLCEFWPKSFAARYSLRMSMFVVNILRLFEIVFAPVLVLMRAIMRFINQGGHTSSQLNARELKRVVRAASSHLSLEEQEMLEGVLDLSQLSVEDVMLPRHTITVLDLSAPIDQVLHTLSQTTSHYILLINDASWSEVQGVLFLKDIALLKDITLADIKKNLKPVGYVQEGTSLNTQLANFKKKRLEVSLVVDEYGESLGVIDVHDIVEEIVGYHTDRPAVPIGSVRFDGISGYWVRADVVVRDLNRYMGWHLPEENATTVGGLILSTITNIPDAPCSITIDDYVVEVVEIKNNHLILVRIKSIIENN